MGNPEYEKGETKSKDESGYSEKQLDVDAEIQGGEWQSLQRYRTYQQRSRQWKIIATHKAVSNRLKQLELLYYRLVSETPTKGEKLLQELKRLRMLQRVLLQCMVWEEKKELEKDMVPVEVWDLIR